MSEWTVLDTWTVVAAAFIAISCALPGTFLVLMRNSLFGDAVSHAVLPGLAVAFLISGNRDPLTMLGGAVVAGTITALLSFWVHKYGEVEQGAALGVVFCSLFALGLILIRAAADRIDLDPDCVLYGTIETAVGDFQPIPAVVKTACIMALVNCALVLIFWKELRIAAFDPGLAEALGFKPQWIRQGLNVMTAVTAVVAFESVGSILVIAMLVGPPVAATLVSRRLGGVLGFALLFAIATGPLGHVLAIWGVPWTASRLLGETIGSVSTAGMMAVATGLLFLAARLWVWIRERFERREARASSELQSV